MGLYKIYRKGCNEDLVKVSVTLPRSLRDSARKKNINLSRTLENAVTKRLNGEY